MSRILNIPIYNPLTNSISLSGFISFIIFSLLIPYVHREGSLGHQARDALLLCMALSQKNSNIGHYIAQYSSICPLLVTGLGGLYSRLPNSIDINSIDWHRITPDDVTEIPELTLFMNALEFCNAVVQVAHEMIKHQLLDFMYQGFIVPVLGPAILQVSVLCTRFNYCSHVKTCLRCISVVLVAKFVHSPCSALSVCVRAFLLATFLLLRLYASRT